MVSGAPINVLDFGAVGDGGTDDFIAIQAAIDSADSTSDTIVIPAGRYLVSKPIQVKTRNIVFQGGVVGAHPTFTSATMADGRTSAAIFYMTGKGGSITGSFNQDLLDIDSSDPNGVALADYCIETLTADNYVLQRLLLQRGKVANICIRGFQFGSVHKEIYSRYSPYGWLCDVFDPVGGVTGNAIFENCYAVQCGIGFSLRNLLAGAMSACATDQCGVGFESYFNARLVINGCNTEGTIKPFIINGGYISVDSWLATDWGTAATGIEASSYSGLTGPITSVTGVNAIDLINSGEMRVAGALFGSGTTSSVEYVVKADTANCRFIEVANWANYGTLPRQNIIQYAQSVGTSAFAVSIPSSNFNIQDLRRFYTNPSNYSPSYSCDSGTFVALTFEPGGTNGSTTAITLGNRASNGDASFINLKSDTEGIGSSAFVVGTRNSYVTQESFRVSAIGTLLPGTNNTQDIGKAGLRWKEIFATNGVINTSDAREKEQDRLLSDLERNVAIKAKALLKTFKWKDAVIEKGNDARIHFGVYAQELAAAFDSEGLDPHSYGIFCYDEWRDEFTPAFKEVVSYVNNTDGTKAKIVEQVPTGEMIQTRVAGNSYGIRYNELFAFIISAL